MVRKDIILYYFGAKSYVYERGYYFETYHYENIIPEKLSKHEFYREYAWVVLSSGMSEKVVLSVFDKISALFNHWMNVKFIIINKERIRIEALKLFNNKYKINAILLMAEHLEKTTIEKEIEKIKKYGINYLQDFKFLGPATSYHFAKNIGINVMKPDRHLIRISNFFGFNDPHVFCDDISSVTGEKQAIIDLILWRYATLNKNYLYI